jgi:hypothetical protein
MKKLFKYFNLIYFIFIAHQCLQHVPLENNSKKNDICIYVHICTNEQKKLWGKKKKERAMKAEKRKEKK